MEESPVDRGSHDEDNEENAHPEAPDAAPGPDAVPPTPPPQDPWSIEDFDDFNAFEGLELGDAPAQLDFDAALVDEDRPDEGFDGEPEEAPPVFDEPADDPWHAYRPGAEPAGEADEPDEGWSPGDEVGSTTHAEHVVGPVGDAAGGYRLDELLEPEHLEEPYAATRRGSRHEPTPGGSPQEADDSDHDPLRWGPEERHPVEPDAPAAAVEAPNDVDEVFDFEDVPDFSRFTQREYVQATTHEYAGLAEEVARAAAAEAPEQIAVAADIPGIESGVVGLDDVVAAAGEDMPSIPARRPSDLPTRALTGVALFVLFVASLFKPYLLGGFIFLVLALAAGELYAVLIRTGHHPLTLFGLLGVVGALLGTWAWGPVAIPVALTLTLTATLVFFGVAADRRDPLREVALTSLAPLWIGAPGAFAMDMVSGDRYVWMVVAVVVTTALMDVAQYFFGRRLGRTPLARVVSPRKTVEGLVGGIVVALGVGAVFGFFEPFDLVSGLVLGATVAFVAPFGDLAVSVLKRAIGVKDMGTILPGHGGVLDRVDAMIFVIPALWVVYAWMGLVG
jgi:phosphatidate cytidylyltransferase